MSPHRAGPWAHPTQRRRRSVWPAFVVIAGLAIGVALGGVAIKAMQNHINFTQSNGVYPHD